MNKEIEKRRFYRHDLERDYIDIIIATDDFHINFGFIKDISLGGISFYNETGHLNANKNKDIKISFILQNYEFVYDVELLRELKTSEHLNLHAGRFKAMSAENKKALQLILNYIKEYNAVPA